jgi:DNA-binding NtrC family response regulator/tetratricopeptide (TPR) repeat protein
MPRIPKLGPRYEYERELGSGGMGRVVLVRDGYLKRELALKLLHEPRGGERDLEQFQREFTLLAQLEHPGIARAYDFGYLGRRAYFTSEFIPGAPLSETIPIQDISQVLAHALDLADSLSFLHRSGILHLDIKPSNIILSCTAARRRPVLIDFGLFRRSFTGAPGTRVRGSLPYMAPEYFGRESLGPWTDVYALGVTVYRLATGRFPRRGPRDPDTRLPGETDWEPAPQPPSHSCPSLPGDVDNVILKCLALDPRARFSCAGELHAALKRIGGGRNRQQGRAVAAIETVGRDAELALVDRFLEGLPRGGEPRGRPETGPRVLLVTGPAGSGQSHLFREIKIRAQTRGLGFYLETGYPGRPGPPGALLHCLSGHVGGEGRSRFRAFLARLRRPGSSMRSETSEAERRLRRAGEVAHAAGMVRQPLLLAVDGLQYFDEVSVGLIVDLVRFLGDREGGERPPIGVAVGYREDGPSVGLLRDLTEYVMQPAKGQVIGLGALGPRETAELYAAMKGEEDDVSPGLGVYQQTGGYPARIAALASPGETPSRADPGGKETAATAGELGALSAHERRLLLTLSLLERPATTTELSRLLGASRSRVARLLKGLRGAGLVQEGPSRSGRPGFLAGPPVGQLRAGAPASERQRIHRRLAKDLCSTASGEDDPRLLEAIHHFRQAGSAASIFKYGVPVARYLRSTFQNRTALELFHEVLKAVPRNRSAAFLELALEIAELQARVGEFDEGIRFLRGILTRSRKLADPWKQRILLRLATLHSRRGDFRRADSLFREGLQRSRRGAARLSREELLFFLNEHAAMKAFVGDYARALELCERGLRLAGRSRSYKIREVALNLYATQANVALRNFDFDEAVRGFETALEIAESIGSVENQAIVLNNLGIVYNQSDRYREAIRTFREAEKTCLEFDEGPSLTFIYGNLALLHAKMGDFDAMERVFAEADRLVGGGPSSQSKARDLGRRQEFFLEHHRGLALLYRGRFAEARAHLEAAVRLGNSVGDRLLTSFDGLYRAEALIFEGAYAEAGRALRRLSESRFSARLRRMALSRLALLSALTAQLEEMKAAVAGRDEVEAERPIPFLDAWDATFLGWAFSLGGDQDRALELLGPPERYFRSSGLRPARALVNWVRAEAYFLRGDVERARELLEDEGSPGNDLTAVLRPLLAARLLLEDSPGAGERARCADLLAGAGAALVGNPMPEWPLRLEALRAALQSDGRTARRARADFARRRKELASELPESARQRYLRSENWRCWTRVLAGVERRRRSGRRSSEEKTTRPEQPASRREADSSTSTRTIALRGRSLREGLVANSRAMVEMRSVLDRLREVDFPVVICGETGTGKEMVARILHAESRRFGGPFLVVDGATIPRTLLEAELFGARAGAFTDLKKDRPGILAQADGGTVVVDEVAGLPAEVQAKLLRLVSEGTLRPVGAEREIHIDVRFLFSTSRDLEEEVREGRLRRDLFHRVQVLTVQVPPLRERLEDLPELVDRFLREESGPPPSLGAGVLEWLRKQRFPGNVRELKNLLSRLRLEHPREISLDAVRRLQPDPENAALFPRNVVSRDTLPALKDQLERDYILYHLQRLEGDTRKLSRLLGVSRKHFYRRCQQLGIRLREAKRDLKT